MFAYEQCLLCLGYYPDIWYEAANFLNTMSVTMQEKGVSRTLDGFFINLN